MTPTKLNATRNPVQIACLACSSVRVVYGVTQKETAECPSCGYVGWTYSDDLDGWTKRAIMNGRTAVPNGRRHAPRR